MAAPDDVTTTELVGGVEQRDLVLVDHDPTWADRFELERARLTAALGSRALRVEHIGSTAVPGLPAKPIVDVLVTVEAVADESRYLPDLLAAGYVLRVREPGHRLVRTPERDVHVHVLRDDDPAADAYLDLRDRLRASAAARDEYTAAKRAIIATGVTDMNAYSDAKSEVIAAIRRDRPRTPPELTDGVVRLRAWEPSDADDVLRACQDPDLQHWLPVPVPYLPAHAGGFVSGFAREQWSSGTGAPFAAVDTDTGRLLGSFGLKDVDAVGRTAEAGYWVAPAARGRGVAQRGVRLLVDWAFGELRLRRVEFLVEPANLASCAVVERVGAVVEELVPAALVIHGTPRDTARYVLTADRPLTAD